MKRPWKAAGIALLLLALASGLVWQFGPFQAVFAIANLSDPNKLATLSPRGANPRLNKIVYWLHEARRKGLSAETAVTMAQVRNWTKEPRASLVKESLMRNLKIADGLGLFTEANLNFLRNGNAAVVRKGPYANSLVEIDHIVPLSLAPEAGNELANLEMMPQPLNRRKSNHVGSRQLEMAKRLFDAGLLRKETLDRVQAQARATNSEPGILAK